MAAHGSVASDAGIGALKVELGSVKLESKHWARGSKPWRMESKPWRLESGEGSGGDGMRGGREADAGVGVEWRECADGGGRMGELSIAPRFGKFVGKALNYGPNRVVNACWR